MNKERNSFVVKPGISTLKAGLSQLNTRIYFNAVRTAPRKETPYWRI